MCPILNKVKIALECFHFVLLLLNKRPPPHLPSSRVQSMAQSHFYPFPLPLPLPLPPPPCFEGVRGRNGIGPKTTRMNAHHHEDSEGPPVSTLDVSLSVDHLGGHVLHRAAEGVGLLMVNGLFTQAEIWNTHTQTHRL